MENYDVVEGIEIKNLRPRDKHVLIRWLKKEETKGGVLIPQTRQRSGFMKGEILSVGCKCDPKIQPGCLVEFNGLGQKEWLGVQDPHDRDTVFFTRTENVYGLVSTVDGKPKLDMVNDWILVKPEVEKEKGGLAVPDTAIEGSMRMRQGLIGKVVSAGSDVYSCLEGDKIAFDATGATKIRVGDHNEEICLVIEDDAVLAEVE